MGEILILRRRSPDLTGLYVGIMRFVGVSLIEHLGGRTRCFAC
jgi:hypothetical protein